MGLLNVFSSKKYKDNSTKKMSTFCKIAKSGQKKVNFEQNKAKKSEMKTLTFFHKPLDKVPIVLSKTTFLLAPSQTTRHPHLLQEDL